MSTSSESSNVSQHSAAPPVVLAVAPGSREEQLLASYESAKAAMEEAKARFESITDALKAAMSGSVPAGTASILLAGSPGLPQLRLMWKTPYRFDVKRFRAEHPALYVRYEVKGGNWELRQV